jgi:hypothetical protein
MHDFDPRWPDDPRDDEYDRDLSRGGRGGSDDRDSARDLDPRDVFMSHVHLPRSLERVHVRHHGVDYAIRGSESRTLATVGAFRVVPAGDLRDVHDKALEPNRGDLYNLRKSGLVQTIPALGRDRALVVLTERGRALLEANRRETHDARQEFYGGLRKPKELTHDSQVYRAYLKTAERLREEGATIRRVILDNELKREYQRFLQERNRGRSDSDGRPDRTPEEIHQWAFEHHLPEQDGHVQIPDARIEYEDRDGRLRTEDLEVETLHYRGGHAAAKASSGFTRHSGSTMRVVGSRGAGGGGGGGRGRRYGLGITASIGKSGGRSSDPRLAEELLR